MAVSWITVFRQGCYLCLALELVAVTSFASLVTARPASVSRSATVVLSETVPSKSPPYTVPSSIDQDYVLPTFDRYGSTNLSPQLNATLRTTAPYKATIFFDTERHPARNDLPTASSTALPIRPMEAPCTLRLPFSQRRNCSAYNDNETHHNNTTQDHSTVPTLERPLNKIERRLERVHTILMTEMVVLVVSRRLFQNLSENGCLGYRGKSNRTGFLRNANGIVEVMVFILS